MKKNNEVDLCISIFYDDDLWYKILNEAIYSFIVSNDIIGFIVTLSRKRGCHIRLTLFSEVRKAKILARKAHRYFGGYIRKHPSTLSNMLIPQNGLFRDFKPNSLHYGVFRVIYYKESSGLFKIYHGWISRILMQIFQTYKQNTLNQLFEIILQLLSIFFRYSMLSKPDALQVLDSLLQEEYKNCDNTALKKIDEINRKNFRNNKSELLELVSPEKIKEMDYYRDSSLDISLKKLLLQLHESKFKFQSKEQSLERYKIMIRILCEAFALDDKISAYYFLSGILRNNQIISLPEG